MKKNLLAVLLATLAISAHSFVAAQPAKAPEPAKVAKKEAEKEQKDAVKNDNCVKKDKNGKCPELPKSPKPTPKKKAEAK